MHIFTSILFSLTCFHLCNAFGGVMWQIYEINQRARHHRHLIYGDVIRPDVEESELEKENDDDDRGMEKGNSQGNSAQNQDQFNNQNGGGQDIFITGNNAQNINGNIKGDGNNEVNNPEDLGVNFDLFPQSDIPFSFKAIIKKQGNNRWKNNEMPYEISSRYSATEKYAIKDAISALQSMTCFKFPQKSSGHKDYIFIDKKDGCYSFVGKKGGKQLVSLGNGCLSTGTIQHELMHALGIEHEHQRPDRDKYIKVKMENVEGGMGSNFNKVPYSAVDLHGLKYDYQSVMHYDGKAFGKTKNGKKLDTMVPIKSGIKLLDNVKLTDQDVQKLKILGGCSSGGKSKKNGKKGKNDKKKKRKQIRKIKKRRMERLNFN